MVKIKIEIEKNEEESFVSEELENAQDAKDYIDTIVNTIAKGQI